MIVIRICLFVIIHVFPFNDIVFETVLFPLFIDLCFPKATIIFVVYLISGRINYTIIMDSSGSVFLLLSITVVLLLHRLFIYLRNLMIFSSHKFSLPFV